MILAAALTSASLIWIALLAFAVKAPPPDATFVSELVYRVSSLVCHQLPDRSFHLGAAQWPVCARCLGLYAAAPLGALGAFAMKHRVRISAPRENFLLLCIAAVPTAATWVGGWLLRFPVSNGARFGAALPLGAAIAWVLVRTALDTAGRHVSQYTLPDARRGPTQ